MKKQMSTALALLVASFACTAQAQQPAAHGTSNVTKRAGEGSTMTNGVPNLLASNVQAGELGLEGGLTLRPASRSAAPATSYGGDPGLKMMGAPGMTRPVLISPPGASR